MTRSWRHSIRSLRPADVAPEIAYAMDYLEAHGYEFCLHFGVKNAIEKAVDCWWIWLTGRLPSRGHDEDPK